MQALSDVEVIALDKTGTLTEGRPALTGLDCAEGVDRSDCLARVAIEAQSEHPVARAIVAAARAEGLRSLPAADVAAIPCHGMRGMAAGRRVLVGSGRLMTREGVDIAALAGAADRLARRGRTTLFAAIDGRAPAAIAVADPVRPSTAAAIAALHARGLEVAMITGDREETARAVARETGIDRVVLPEGKVAALRARPETLFRAPLTAPHPLPTAHSGYHPGGWEGVRGGERPRNSPDGEFRVRPSGSAAPGAGSPVSATPSTTHRRWPRRMSASPSAPARGSVPRRGAGTGVHPLLQVVHPEVCNFCGAGRSAVPGLWPRHRGGSIPVPSFTKENRMQSDDDRIVADLMEQSIESGRDGMAAAVTALMTLAMRIERERHRGARPYERSPDRAGHANGYKPKTIDTAAGTLSVHVPKSRGGETPVYPQALERGRAPWLAAWLEQNAPEGRAVVSLPEAHWRRMRTANPIERAIQHELKRRTRKIRVFPGETALERLATAIPVGIDEEWIGTGRACLTMKDRDG